jgi:hypothetical protein
VVGRALKLARGRGQVSEINARRPLGDRLTNRSEVEESMNGRCMLPVLLSSGLRYTQQSAAQLYIADVSLVHEELGELH